METFTKVHGRSFLISQLRKNTSVWIGHIPGYQNDHFAGEIFLCPATSELTHIQLFLAAVQNPGEVFLTLHSFDEKDKKWGPQIAVTKATVSELNKEEWMCFELPGTCLVKNEYYGFRLHTNQALVAIGEAAAGAEGPFEDEEWSADLENLNGHYYKYFSLTFKIELETPPL